MTVEEGHNSLDSSSILIGIFKYSINILIIMEKKKDKKEVVKVQATFTKKQMEVMRNYRDIFGDSDAEIVRAIVMNWLSYERNKGGGGE